MTAANIPDRALVSGLIVDDSPIMRILLKRILSSYSIECDEAGTGRDALRKFEQRLEARRPYGVLFLDVQMPEMDGCAALTQVRSIEKQFPDLTPVYVVVITADDSVETIKAMHSAGANAYCLKPVDRESVGRHVEKAREKSCRAGAC